MASNASDGPLIDAGVHVGGSVHAQLPACHYTPVGQRQQDANYGYSGYSGMPCPLGTTIQSLKFRESLRFLRG